MNERKLLVFGFVIHCIFQNSLQCATMKVPGANRTQEPMSKSLHPPPPPPHHMGLYPSTGLDEISLAKTQGGTFNQWNGFLTWHRPLICVDQIKSNNELMNFGALLATHLRMNHKLGAVNQQHYAKNEQGTKVLRLRRVVWKPDVVTRSFSTFARVLATMATNFWWQV